MENSDQQLQRVIKTLSSKHYSWIFYTEAECPPTLVEALTAKLPHIDPATWPKLIDWGGVWVNGLTVRGDMPLTAPVRLEFYESLYDIDQADRIFPEWKHGYVIYQDADLLCVFKPAGIPTFAAKDQRHYNLRRVLEREFGPVLHMPSRLDTSVCGLVICSIAEPMHKYIQQLFEKRKIEKFYLFQSAANVPWQNYTVDGAIDKDPRHAVLRKVVETGGKPSLTEFTKLLSGRYLSTNGESHEATLFEAKPKTGRTHQIRVHAAHAGLPIIGDSFYGGIEDESLHLMSYKVRLPLPSGEILEVKVPDCLLPRWARGVTEVRERS